MKKMFSALSMLSVCVLSAQLYTSGSTVGSITNTATNNVGIGTNNPQQKLEVLGHASFWDIISSGENSWIFHTPDGVSNTNLLIAPKIGSAYEWSVQTKFQNNGDVHFSGDIYTPKNMGVGTINPQYKLTVHNNGAAGSNQFALTTAHNRNVDRYFMKNIIQGQGVDDVTFSLRHDGQMFVDGNVGIGTNNPQYKLDVIGKSSFSDNVKVNAKLESKEIKVTLTPTADFVFEESYDLPKLEEVEKHIKEKKHLPEIASAKQMEKEGVNVGEFQIKLLQKIEELTLYTIEQNKRIKELESKINKK
jgi:hypothetical protein